MNLLGMRVQDRSRVEGIRRGEQVPRAFGRAWMEPVMSTRRNRCCYTVGAALRHAQPLYAVRMSLGVLLG